MAKKIVALLLISFFLVTSCITTSGDLTGKDYAEGDTFAVGKVEVFINGSKDDIHEILGGGCLLTIENEGKTQQYRLEKSGELYMKVNPGVFYFKYIKCPTGFFSDSSQLFYPKLPASVLERGQVNYVGDLAINWNLGDSELNLGRSLSEFNIILNRYGPIELAIKNNQGETMKAFFSSHQKLTEKKEVARLIKIIDAAEF